MGPLLATNIAFIAVFGIFVIAFVGLCTFIAVWAIRRDRAGRQEWLAEHEPESPEG